ncbi:T9SS type A sorting domain-containing protein [Pontibacter sp. E15-1]|uniref:T9SS type A sorting domain-containing protein n=1 Tax=Pontibacter sp. E15-1 TaxID=2919918 RepID=UPI001F5040EE|nr:T9SS type A sorting domain-containing protein [Pontibacter sp. E15-1]MCJ8163859.1 T9SS type A sorting domain-containing protein [Pontibacter sp. E15-1]
MKNFTLFLIAFLTLTIAAKAQVLVYHENFNNTVTGVTGNFTSSITTPATDTLYTAGAYMEATNLASQLVLNNSISTYNLNNISIEWKEYRTQYWRKTKGQQDNSTTGGKNYEKIDNTKAVSLEYSLDGVTYTAVGSYAANTTFFAWTTVNNGVVIKLPAAAENQPNVRLRWKVSVNNANTDYYAMDDVILRGTPVIGTSAFKWSTRPVNEDPFTTSSGASNPYKVDGVALQWSKATIGTGITLQTAAVTTDFHKKNNLTLIQTGAAANTGTEVTLQLSQSVAGLTFDILDVDRTSGQYKDRIQVIGYNGTQIVAITKNSILPRIANEYKSGLIVAKGDNVDGVDSKVTSSKGNVTISFVGDVNKVVIRYFNEDAAKGRQGIAITDLSWGSYDAAISTLPVELAFFKAYAQNGNAKLGWSTASEENNEKFVVERSQDGKAFRQIGQVKGNGTSSSQINYSFTDTNPAAGVNYYRLQQVDFDGTATFSNVVAVEFGKRNDVAVALATVYPTVASAEVTVSLNTDDRTSIIVMDATGKTVAQYTNVADRALVVPVQHLNKGVYFVTVANGQQRETQRFVKN